MSHAEMSAADDLETALAGPLAADDRASVPLPAPASSNLPLKNGSQRGAFIIHFPSLSLFFPLFSQFSLSRRSSLCLLVSPASPARRAETGVAGGRPPRRTDDSLRQ